MNILTFNIVVDSFCKMKAFISFHIICFISQTKSNHSFYFTKTSNTRLEKSSDYIFILKGADTEGIVHQCTHLFSNLNINIIDLETKLIHAPITGTPLFYIKSILSVPQNVSISKIKKQIINLENTSNVKIKFMPYDPNY